MLSWLEWTMWAKGPVFTLDSLKPTLTNWHYLTDVSAPHK